MSTDLRWLNIEHPCHCGSGGHPRECSRHPFGKRLHVAELNAENNLDACEEAERELAEARAEIARLKAAIEQVRELAASAELIDGGVTFRELVLEAIVAEGAAL